MRLGQIKKEYGLEPSKVADFLNKEGIEISKHPNSKVSDDQLALILKAFEDKIAVQQEEPQIEEATAAKEEKPKKKAKKEEAPEIGEVIDLPKEEEKKAEQTPTKRVGKDEFLDFEGEEIPEDVEVIKAPKIELEGVKVLGKIDLPEPPKKEVEEVEEPEEEVVEEEDELSHLHPSKRAKAKVEDIKEEIPVENKPRPQQKKKKKKVNPKVQKAQKAQSKRDKAAAKQLGGKKRKQIERDEKMAAAEKARQEQEYIKKHGPKKKKKVQPQRIQVRKDGTIVPRHEMVEEKKEGWFKRFWRWFNS